MCVSDWGVRKGGGAQPHVDVVSMRTAPVQGDVGPGDGLGPCDLPATHCPLVVPIGLRANTRAL